MKHGMDVRAEAVRYFETGFANKTVGRLLGIPHSTVKRWLHAYRALGKEALFVTTHRKYDHETKVRAARAVIEGSESESTPISLTGATPLPGGLPPRASWPARTPRG